MLVHLSVGESRPITVAVYGGSFVRYKARNVVEVESGAVPGSSLLRLVNDSEHQVSVSFVAVPGPEKSIRLPAGQSLFVCASSA